MGIISYAGGMSIAIAADCVPKSQGIARAICTRFERRFQDYVSTAEKILSETKDELASFNIHAALHTQHTIYSGRRTSYHIVHYTSQLST